MGQKANIAFVGIGRMGSPMLKCVLNAGYRVTLYDPSESATAPFVSAHPDRVRVAPTAKEAAQAADVIDVVVNTNEQLLDACLGPKGVLAGAPSGGIVLIHSTVSHETLQRLAGEASRRGVHLLDAMVSGARGHLSVGKLAVMVGGNPDAFARAKPVMDTYGSLVLHLGPQGAGLDAKLALNMLRYLCMVASQEASLLAERAGVGAVMSELVAHTEANRYVGDLKRLERIELAQRRKEAETSKKDLRAAIQRGAELGLRLPSADRALDLMSRLWAAETE
jgi:3-hydroxyisobutyrate dehydrogenase-like beta-hydroxyacid dehydrogenase